MRIINKRYDTCRKLRYLNGMLEYKVFDRLLKKECKVTLFTNDSINENIKMYLCNNFQTIKNLNFEGVYNVYELLTVKEVDGINLEMIQYGFVSEWCEDERSLLTYILEESEEDIVNILFELMCKLNTLNLNGFIYSKLKISEINVCLIEGSYQIKLPSVLLEKIGGLENEFNKYGNVLDFSDSNINSDKETNILEVFRILKEVFKKRNDLNLKILIELKKEMEKNKVLDITELINCFNNKFFDKHRRFIKDSVDRVENDIDIVGREVEISNVMEQFEEILINNINSKAIVFDGGSGVGKTKLLNEIKRRMEYRYNTSIVSILKNEKGVIIESNNCAKDYNYTRSFKNEFRRFMEEFSKRLTKGYSQTSIEDVKECYKLVNLGIKLFEKHARIRPCVLVIDNLEKRNRVAKLFLKQLLEGIKEINNIMILISVDTTTENEEFKEYYKNILFNKSVFEYKIGMLNKYDTKKMIEKVLKSKGNINEINEVIYKDTIGNPDLIMKKILDMYRCKSISIAKNGLWKYKSISFHINPISYLEEKYIEKIEKLSFFENSVLKKLAIYNYAIEEKIFLENIIITTKEREAYRELKEQNIIIESYDNNGINIDFKEYFYKKIIYKRMSKKQRIVGHLKYIGLLEGILKESERYYEELIYQLEQVEEYDKMISYSKRYSESLIKEGNIEEGINLYKRIFDYLSDVEKLYISYEIGNVYERTEMYMEALKFYRIANEIAIKSRNYSYIVESSLNIAKINIEQESYEEAVENMNVAKKNLLNIDYKLGYAKYFLIKAIYLKYIGDKEEVIEFSSKAYSICEKNNNVGVIGDIYLLLFKYAIEDKNYKMAEVYVSYCERIFKKSTDGKKYYEMLVNRATLLIERDRNLKEGEKILNQILKDSAKNKMDTIRYYALVQFANMNMYLDKREEAKECLLISINLIKGNKNLKRYLGFLYEYLVYIAGIERDIEGIIKYKNIILDSGTKKNYKMLYGLYYYVLGDYQNFKELVEKNNLRNYKLIKYDIGSYFELNMLILVTLNTEEEVIEEIRRIERKLKKNFDERDYSNRIAEIILILNELGYEKISKKMFRELENKINLVILDEKIYIKIINKFKGNSVNCITNRSIRLLSKVKEGMEKIDMYYMIGENYEKCNVYNLAFENYYEGLIMLSNYIRRERLEDRRKILSCNRFYMLLERFLYCANEKLNIGIQINTFMKTDLEIEKFLEQIKVSKMMENKNFKKIIMDKYEKIYLNNFENTDVVLKNFKEDVAHNIESMMKYIVRSTLATSAILTLKNNDKVEIVYSYRINKKEVSKRLLNKKINIEFFIVNNEDRTGSEIYDEIIPKGIKSCLYKRLDRKYGEGTSYKNLEGELILMSDKLINNINKEAYENIKEFETTLLFLLDQYKMTRTSTRDKLTGAFNRGYFEKTMDNIIRDFNYEDKIFSLIIFDIDNFKGVNDKFGHQTGDMVLEKISELVKESIEKKDIFSRYGGEEFVIICPGEGEEETFKKAEIVRRKIEDENILRGIREVTISLGISSYPKHSKKKEELIQKADQALYVAKRGTKNVVKVWNESFDSRIESTDKLAGLITGAANVDNERIASIVEMIDVIKSDMRREFKLYKILRRILKNTNSKDCLVFKVSEEKLICEMKITEDKKGWKEEVLFNEKLVTKVIKEGKGIYDIDWEEVRKELNSTSKINSVCIVPLINRDKVKGCLYLSAPIKRKEFDFKDYSYINTLGNSLSILF